MQSVNVLIVDDDVGDRKLIKRLLAKTDFNVTVHEATSVEDIATLDPSIVDAIFLDNLLPGATGIGHLEDIKARWPWAPIFFMTGQGDEYLAKTAIKNGAADYIPKHSINQSAITRMLKNGLTQAHAQWRLDEQRADLATFSEVLVHDFRAPIRAAVFLTEQIEEDIATGDLDMAVDSLRLLRKSANQMQEMIRSLADHVRLDRDINVAEATAAELCDRALLALDREIRESRAKISTDFSEAPAPFLCRPLQLVQVLQNLVANAIKYCGKNDPEIHIAARFDQDHNLVFEVSDKGIGVPEDHAERIFEPFKRAPGASDLAGTGLGLATCRKIVSRHGGRIWCRPEQETGTTIAFLIPAAQDVHVHAG